jgi:hypothetical protein
MVCSCAAAAGTAGMTLSADEITRAVPADSGGGGGGGGGGRQHKRPRAGCRKRRVARDWRVPKLQPQTHELLEDTRESPSPVQNRTFSLGFGEPKRVGLCRSMLEHNSGVST